MVGVQRFGCLAEKVVVPVQTLYPLPKGLTYEQAASIPLVFQTAWHMLVDRARLKVGEDVLIQAAGSGVGIAAIQIAKLHGAILQLPVQMKNLKKQKHSEQMF
jgi:NADPH:quinone reductase-like Zn-dependent oxidoreductase